ncbi:Integral membrane protein (putative) [Streptococcus sp. HSISB1]|nr:Integral membrane protein (putative) [Streptococcus sp. HSISB1]
MTKSEYLAKLDKYLKKLPKEDYLEAMDYFREYFDEAGPENEEEVIAELGTPKEAAHDIISRLLNEKIVEDEKTPKNRAVIFWIAILAILASPVALPLIFLLLMIIVAIVAVVVSILVAVIALGVGLFISGGALLVNSWSYLNISYASTTLGLGLGLLAGGLSILAILAAGAVCKYTGIGLVNLTKIIANKRRKS